MDKEATTPQLDQEPTAAITALRAENQRLQAEMSRQQTAIRALGEEAARYRNLIAASNDAIFLLDPECDQILEANPVACRLLGYSQAELLELSVSAIHPSEMPQLLRFARQVFAKGQGWTDELSCRTKAGATLPAEISASLVEIGGRTCLLALVRDTTERRRAAERIQQEAARADALARVAARLNAQLDLATVLDAICEETARALKIPATVLLFFDEKRELFYPVATYGLPPAFKDAYIPNPRSVYDQYPQQGSQIVVPNLRALPNLVNAQLFETYNIHAIAIASLNRDDHLLGALSAYALDPSHSFTEDDVNLLRSLADLGAQAVRNATLYQAEQRRSAQFQTLSEVGRHITAFLQEDELNRQLAQSVRQLFR
jgi:PAS domain S-box-containing protein